jgi:hypothetical protein
MSLSVRTKPFLRCTNQTVNATLDKKAFATVTVV